MSHTCHAHGCNRPVPPKMMCCKPHWYALPKPLRDAVWLEYKPQQELRKNPSARYIAVQRVAIAFLAHDNVVVHAELLTSAREWRTRAMQLGQGDPFVGLEAYV